MEKQTTKEQARENWEVFIEIASPCSCSHLRMLSFAVSGIFHPAKKKKSNSAETRTIYCTDSDFKDLLFVCMGVFICLRSQSTTLQEKVALSVF